MSDVKKQLKPQTNALGTVLKVLPLIAFTVPLALLFILNPPDPFLKISTQSSFELMWKGRTFELFFLWLIALEFILEWDAIKLKIGKHNKARVAGYIAVLALPTLFIVLVNFLGFNAAIANWASLNGIAFWESMPLAFEYLVLCGLFLLAVTLPFGKRGLTGFALPALFLALVGVLYTIDNVYPYGSFTPFQILVPTTANLASSVLNFMGNTAVMGVDPFSGMPTIDVSGSLGTAKFAIAWPCAGIESFLIFTAVALLFLKRMQVSWKAKVGFFAVGVLVTYLINVARITVLFIIAMQHGVNSIPVQDFHFYYGPLYAMTWIISYPLILMGGIAAWRKVRKPQPAPQAPA